MFNKHSLRHGFIAFFCFAGMWFCAACSRDPNVAKQKYFDSGKHYSEKGKYKEAAIQFTNALRYDSNFAEAHYQLALVDLRLGAAQNAYLELSKTVALQPDNLDAHLDLGRLLLMGGESQKALDQAIFVLQKDQSNVSALVLKADTEASKHQLDDALSDMNAAVQVDPNRAASYLKLGVFEGIRGTNSTDAEANLKRAIQLDPKSIQGRIILAYFYDSKKRFAEAEQQLQQALAISNKDTGVRSALINHYLLTGRKDLAETFARESKSVMASDPRGVQLLGRYYLSVGDINSAATEYSALAAQFPKDRDIQDTNLRVLLLSKNRSGALSQAESVLKRFPKDEFALTSKAALLLDQGKAAESRTLVADVIKANPQNVAAHFILGNAFNVLGDQGQAATEWAEAARLRPSYLPAQKELARLAIMHRDPATLAQIADTVVQRVPGAPDGYVMKAEAAAFNNDAKNAEDELKKAIQAAPQSTEAYVQLGRLQAALKRYSDAKRTLEQVLQFDPQNTQAMRVLLQVDLGEKSPSEAMQRARDFVTDFPENAGAHLLYGELAFFEKNLDVAEQELTKVTELSPSNLQSYYELAAIQSAKSEFTQAQSTYGKAISRNHQDSTAYWMLATLFERQNDVKDAEANYRKALEVKPDSGIAANNLAYLLLQHGGNIDEVISYAETARRQLPNAPAVADTLGWAYYQKGLPGLAVQVLQDAVNGTPESATYHYHLAMAYARNGDRLKAKSELEKAAALKGSNPLKTEIEKAMKEVS